MVDLTQEEQAGGYLYPERAPKSYRWAANRLVEEFGKERVRLEYQADFGRTQKIAIYFAPDEDHPTEEGVGIPLYQADRPELGQIGFDLNQHPEMLDRMIETGKKLKMLWEGATAE